MQELGSGGREGMVGFKDGASVEEYVECVADLEPWHGESMEASCVCEVVIDIEYLVNDSGCSQC